MLPSSTDPLGPLTDLLDVRESPNGRFVSGAACIPLTELRDRLSELPPSGNPFKIAAVDSTATDAESFLIKGGRHPILTTEFELTSENLRFRMWRPNQFLESLSAGRHFNHAVDLGCGVGREAIYLASQGTRVDAVDNLPDAIIRANQLAERYGLASEITWRRTEAVTLPVRLFESCDLVYAFFFLDREAIRHALNSMPQGAALALETFTETHFEKYGKPSPDRYLRTGELLTFSPNLRIEHHEEAWREDGRHTVRFLATKL